MPRYIDAHMLIDQLGNTSLYKKTGWLTENESEFAQGFEGAVNVIKGILSNYPTADVVPRSEVEELKKEYEEKIAELNREIDDLESTQEITPEAKYFVDTKADKMISLLHKINDEIDKAQDLEKAKQKVAREMLTAFSPFRALSPKLCEVYYELEKKYIGETKCTTEKQ